MSFISLWSVIASALLSPASPPSAPTVPMISQRSQPTIAAEPIAVPMTASRPDFIVADQPASPAPKSSARSLKRLVADLSTPKTSDASHDCLAATIYFESRAEPLEGQLAVAEVVINRTQAPNFRRTICGVVKQPKQFSFVRNGAIPFPDRNSRAWKRSVAVARIARDNLWSSSAANALFFHADHASPSWRHSKKRQATLGNHIFYR